MKENPIITIESINVQKPFKYIWLKNIDSLDLSKHCAAGLIGKTITTRKMWQNIINKSAETKLTLRSASGLYYLCGVSEGYVWENNFHLAFRYADDAKLVKNDKGIITNIRDAVEIPIVPVNLKRCPFPGRNFPEFYTCRNWQFANMLVNGEVPGYRVERRGKYWFKVMREDGNDMFGEIEYGSFF